MESNLTMLEKIMVVICSMGIGALSSGCQAPAETELLDSDQLANTISDTIIVKELTRVMGHYPEETQLALGWVSDSTTKFKGVKRVGDQLMPVDNAHLVFEIGSISKVFTAHLAAVVVANGQMEWDDHLDTYVDILPDTPITLQQLANHTSGLPRIPPSLIWSAVFHSKNPYRSFSATKLEAYLSEKMKVENEPGATYAYSNLGAGILGYVCTQVAGTDYETMLQKYICRKLDMSSTTTQRDKVSSKLVRGLSRKGYETRYWDMNALVGAGGILSNVRDLANYARCFFEEDTVVVALTSPTHTISDKMSIARGWHLLKQEHGQFWLWHNGGTGGFRSSMLIDRQQRKAVIVLSNISAGHSNADQIDQLSQFLLSQLIDV